MIRETSSIAYKEIYQEGIADTQKERILNLLTESNTPLSRREICKYTGYDINAVSGRVNELLKESRVREYEKRKCNITGRLIMPVGIEAGQLTLL
jgi:predicted transcriptional regulator